MDMRTLEREEPVFVRKGYDVDGILRAPGSRMPAGYAVTEERLVQHWVDPDMQTVQAALDKAVGPGRTATITSISRGRERMIVLVGSPSEPGRWFVLDRANEKMTPFAWVNDAIRQPLHPVKSIRYKARDGLEIHAVLTMPRGRPASALPLVVMPHGGPHMRDSETWDWWAQFLADRGYAVVQPNYRGSTGFGEAFLKAGDGQWGLAMQDDLVDAVRHLAAEKLIDPARVCIVGGSYGGYAAIRAAQRDTGVYRCAVSFAGISDLTRMLRYDRGFFGRDTANDYWKGQTPDLSAVSPLQGVDQVSIPVLLVHGRLDSRVPFDQSKLFAAALERAGKPHRYVLQPRGDHSLSREEDRIAFLKELEAFLQQHNPA
jgi:dipeptidyl aminopeptidase/acylaminoacyl peptidase